MKVLMPSFSLDVSHSQVAVFDQNVERPFSYWTDAHVRQGFAWRADSASFRTLQDGRHRVDVLLTSDDVPLSPAAVRIIAVPFEAPAAGSIEVASIAHGVPLDLPAGRYQLRYEYQPADGNSEPRIRLVFVAADKPKFAILRADNDISASGEWLMTAEPA